MIYAEYFGLMVNNYCVPKLNKEQFKRMMNIIHIEGIIIGMQQSGEPDKYVHQRYRQTKSLNELTKRQKPEVIYADLIKQSEKDFK